MASHHNTSIVAVALLFGLLLEIPSGVRSIGVCYGMLGDNLPQPSDVVKLYKSKNIGAMRLYGPDQGALQALRGSSIKLLLDVDNKNLQGLASDPNYANSWVQTNVKAYVPDVSFRYIAVGNEVIPGDKAQYVLPAMQNIQNALSAAGLNQIKVSTSVSQGVIGGYPPSAGVFSDQAKSTMQPIVQFLARNGAPLLVNVYPYFSYIYNRGSIRPEYALFTSPGTVVTDGQYKYQNLFDALVDTVYSAMEKVGAANVPIVVSESGWPSAGGDPAVTTAANAQTYNQNLIKHVGQGTPKRPGAIDTYIFAMFNENQKTGDETEKHFGLFNPNQQPAYPISF